MSNGLFLIPVYADKELTGRAYWANQLVDLPLLGMDTNACNYTTCPIKANQKQTYDYKLEISSYFPVVSVSQLCVSSKAFDAGRIHFISICRYTAVVKTSS